MNSPPEVLGFPQNASRRIQQLASAQWNFPSPYPIDRSPTNKNHSIILSSEKQPTQHFRNQNWKRHCFQDQLVPGIAFSNQQKAVLSSEVAQSIPYWQASLTSDTLPCLIYLPGDNSTRTREKKTALKQSDPVQVLSKWIKSLAVLFSGSCLLTVPVALSTSYLAALVHLRACFHLVKKLWKPSTSFGEQFFFFYSKERLTEIRHLQHALTDNQMTQTSITRGLRTDCRH